MDLTADSPLKPATGGHDVEYPLLYIPQEVDSGIISLQLLEFKTRLLEAVEELHIHRDAETRNEDQMSKLVLETQELAWQKESLQRQMETMANQHAESLASVNKQFQIKLGDVEGEKGRYQLSTELKDKETSSLKEELKQLQLFKYSLEKKLSELDQKLQLQSQSRDRHLSQLGEVEKRFGALSRQCALVKQAHAKLEQNVDESMRQNKKLSSLNSRNESTIKALKQSLEELNNKLINARVSSVGRSENNHAAKDQLIQQLQHRLHVEMEMNKKLGEENATERAAKQEVMTSLQHTQQLLLAQTQAVCRSEQELRTQREQHQSLKGEHEVMRARVDAKEDRSSVLEEQSRNARLIWGNEKLELLERIRSEQQDLRCVREAYDSLHHTHAELLSQAVPSAEHTREAQEDVKPNQNATAERGGLSSHSGDVLAEDVLGGKTVDQTVQFHPTQNDRQDKPSDTVSSMESQSEGQTSSSQVITLPQSPSVYSPGCLNTDSLVTETAAVVDVLTRPVCGAPEGQPGESDPEPRRNSAQGERRDSDPTVLCGLPDRACRSGDVGSGEGAVWTRLSCSDNRSVYSGAEGSGPAVKVAKDEREEEEGGMERSEETAKLQTCSKQEPRHRGGLSSPEDVDRHDPEAPVTQNAHPHREASHMEKDSEVRLHARDDSFSLSPVEAQSHNGAQTQQADPLQHHESEDKSEKPVRERQGVGNSSQHEPSACQNTSPESAPVTGTCRFGTCETPAEPTDAELDPDRPPPHLASSMYVDPPSSAREAECAVTVAGVTRHQHADVDQQAISTLAESPVPDPENDMVDIPLRLNHPTELVGESQCGDIDHLASSKKYRSAFDWTAQNHTRNKLGPPDKDHGTPTSQKPSVSDLNIRQPLLSLPTFLQGRQGSRDAVIMQSGAAEVCSAAGPLSSLREHQQGEWKAIREAFCDTSAEKEGRVSISVSSPLVPQYSTATSRLPWQPNNSSSGGCSGLDLSASQDIEDTQQSDIRAQITRIEQFLSSDRLQTPKRRRTDRI
ncbi:uncharacterized protein LOC134020651 [Osmerus eperlanus]|uniref:uncharacterized protein LOC134020651 n=1 Tax=Osmerus eperlanus TaxID=29151 RepID=UPI002E0DCF1B